MKYLPVVLMDKGMMETEMETGMEIGMVVETETEMEMETGTEIGMVVEAETEMEMGMVVVMEMEMGDLEGDGLPPC